MIFSTDYQNKLWKIKISDSIDHSLENDLIKLSTIYCELDKQFVFSFESISDFTDACCKLRNHGYCQ